MRQTKYYCDKCGIEITKDKLIEGEIAHKFVIFNKSREPEKTCNKIKTCEYKNDRLAYMELCKDCYDELVLELKDFLDELQQPIEDTGDKMEEEEDERSE